MGMQAPGAEAPFKYTKESFIGVRDAWISFAADRLSKAAAALEQYAEKLPESVKSKIPIKPKAKPDTSATSATSVQS